MRRRSPRIPPAPRTKQGALAQLVERFNGIEEVNGSTPLCSSLRPFVRGEESSERINFGRPGLPAQRKSGKSQPCLFFLAQFFDTTPQIITHAC